ncbi:MAG: methyltransferase domain-containing protein [Candidatus Rokuibacteriota bacterium]
MLRAFAPWPREVARTEFLDHRGTSPIELAECLGDIARLNRLGPTQALLAHVAPFFDRHRGPEPLRVLDLGTGAADIPVALVKWARARGRRVTVLALDAQPDVLACARSAARAFPEVRLAAGDALKPPVRPGGVDLALCSLTLHHLSEEAVVALLRLMADRCRLGFIVSDLTRSRLAYAAAWLATRALSHNRLTRHDGPLSVRRAYTRAELARLAAAAGVQGMRWRTALFFRLIGVYEKR